MKATIELPDALYREIRIRAAQEGRKVKELVAELLMRGLYGRAIGIPPLEEPRIGKDPVSGLPLIRGGHPAAPGEEVTPEAMKQILLDQEVERFFEAGR